MIEESDVPLLGVDFKHLEDQVHELFVNNGQHNALVLETKPFKPFLHIFASRR